MIFNQHPQPQIQSFQAVPTPIVTQRNIPNIVENEKVGGYEADEPQTFVENTIKTLSDSKVERSLSNRRSLFRAFKRFYQLDIYMDPQGKSSPQSYFVKHHKDKTKVVLKKMRLSAMFRPFFVEGADPQVAQ